MQLRGVADVRQPKCNQSRQRPQHHWTMDQQYPGVRLLDRDGRQCARHLCFLDGVRQVGSGPKESNLSHLKSYAACVRNQMAPMVRTLELKRLTQRLGRDRVSAVKQTLSGDVYVR